MKTLFQFLIFILLFLPGAASAQLEKLIVETYYISDKNDSTDTDSGHKLEMGSVTYRVFADLKPNSRLVKIYGDTNHVIKFSSTTPFYNNVDGDTYGKDLKKVAYKYNTTSLDTWLTLGQTTRTQAGKTYFGVLKTNDDDGSFVGGVNNDGGTLLIPGGLLTNTAAAAGIPLTVSDGMDTMVTLPTAWLDYGIKDFLSGNDSTMFGYMKVQSGFKSYNFFLKNSGITGVDPVRNEILIAQLTTKGELTFELNLEVEELVNGVLKIVKYVANDSILLPGEKKSSYLKYPFPPQVCGCKDPAYIEYNPNLECADNAAFCIKRIVFGCMDTMACNYDPGANFNLKSLCCYPGSCGGRDISVVCPSVRGSSFDCILYPNPAQTTIFLDVTSGTEGPVSYSVYNYFGTPVITHSLGTSNRILGHEIDLSGLVNGLYLIKINVGNNYINKQFFKN